MLERLVACDEPPASVVENAYLILQVLWQDRLWRVLVRLRIVVGRSGVPQPMCEAITAHQVGFSGPSQT